MQQTQAIIVAGGTGKRMMANMPKQFLCIHDKPIIIWTLQAFEKFSIHIELIIVVTHTHKNYLKNLLLQFPIRNKIIIVDGGSTRFESVQNGVKVLHKDSIVFVHDAVRCMISPTLIKKCYDAALQYGSAVPAIDVKDSIRHISGDVNLSIDRSNLKIIQTPQTFKSPILIEAFLQVYKESFTDEASILDGLGKKVHLIDGEENNFKITTPNDLLFASCILQANKIDK